MHCSFFFSLVWHPHFRNGLLNPRDVIAVDFDRDGDDDIVAVFGVGHALSIYTNDGTGTFTFTLVDSCMLKPAEELEGDGRWFA